MRHAPVPAVALAGLFVWLIHGGSISFCRAPDRDTRPTVAGVLSAGPTLVVPSQPDSPEGSAVTETLIVVVVLVLVVLGLAVRIVRQYEQGVLFRLDRLRGPQAPGLHLIIPFIDVLHKVSLRIAPRRSSRRASSPATTPAWTSRRVS